jgi:hypothetical protein
MLKKFAAIFVTLLLILSAQSARAGYCQQNWVRLMSAGSSQQFVIYRRVNDAPSGSQFLGGVSWDPRSADASCSAYKYGYGDVRTTCSDGTTTTQAVRIVPGQYVSNGWTPVLVGRDVQCDVTITLHGNKGGTDTVRHKIATLADDLPFPTSTLDVVSPGSATGTLGVFVWPQPLNFSATVSSFPGRSVTKLEFHDAVSRQMLGEDATAPYELEVRSPAIGRHDIYTVAVLDDGTRVPLKNHRATMVANELPSLKLLTPTPNQKFVFPSTISIQATAADRYGFVRHVRFYEGSNVLHSITRSGPSVDPYVFNWANAPVGPHSIVVEAEDDRGAKSRIGTLPFVVANSAPIVSMTQPADATFYATRPASIALTATAVDDGDIAALQFQINSVGSTNINLMLPATRSGSTFTANWQPPAESRKYTITAVATDNSVSGGTPALSTTSLPHEIFVDGLAGTTAAANLEPYSRIVSPITGAELKPSGSFTVSARVKDIDSPAIAQVEFFIDGVSLGFVNSGVSEANGFSLFSKNVVVPPSTTLCRFDNIACAHKIKAVAKNSLLSGAPSTAGHSIQVPISVVSNLSPLASVALPGGVTSIEPVPISRTPAIG